MSIDLMMRIKALEQRVTELEKQAKPEIRRGRPPKEKNEVKSTQPH